jgi:hypothetical protein
MKKVYNYKSKKYILANSKKLPVWQWGKRLNIYKKRKQNLETIMKKIPNNPYFEMNKRQQKKVVDEIYNINDFLNEIYLTVFEKKLSKKKIINYLTNIKDESGNHFVDNQHANDFYYSLTQIKSLYQQAKKKYNKKTRNKSLKNKKKVKRKSVKKGGASTTRKYQLPDSEVTLMDVIFHPLWILEKKIGLIVELPLDFIGIMSDNIALMSRIYFQVSGFALDNTKDILSMTAAGLFTTPLLKIIIGGKFVISQFISYFLRISSLALMYNRKQYELFFYSFIGLFPNSQNLLEIYKRHTYNLSKYSKRVEEMTYPIHQFLDDTLEDLEKIEQLNSRKIAKIENPVSSFQNPLHNLSDQYKKAMYNVDDSKNNINLLLENFKQMMTPIIESLEDVRKINGEDIPTEDFVKREM